MRKPDEPSERDITRAIRQLLNTLGIFHWKQHQGLGSTPGIPDIICCHQGRLVGIEVKTKRGSPSIIQQKTIDRINEAGGLAFIARSIDDVICNMGLSGRTLL